MFALSTLLAALCFSVAGYFMKQSAGLTQTAPTIVMFVLVAIGAAAQAVAMRHHEMTATYVVVLGVEAVTAMMLGGLLLGERPTLAHLAGTALVLSGVMVLHASSV
ncbi:MAG: SMR family transporter [Gemmatimonadota bacterium]